MRFALLGYDADAWAVAEAAARDAEHELAWGCELGEAENAFRALAPRARLAEHWEVLLADSDVGAVIVARAENEDLRADALRKLVQAGAPLLVMHPVHSSMLIYYELDMIRQESRALMLPYAPAAWHPAFRQLVDWVGQGADSPLGAAEQVVIERALADRSAGEVLRRFTRDANLGLALGGELTSIAAMNAGAADAAYASLGVQMSGPAGVLVRWSVGPVEQGEGARLVLVGKRGKASLWMPEGDHPWRLETNWGGQHEAREFADWNAPGEALRQMARAAAGESVRPHWQDASQAMELADSIELSLRKGKTIQLHFEEHTEEATFKGLMASVGCGLLMLALVVTFLGVVLSWMQTPGAGWWPYLLAGLLGLFLLLQFLKLVFPAEEKP